MCIRDSYWNGTDWSSSITYLDANLTNNGGNWTLPGVDLTAPANYRIRLIAIDAAGNVARVTDNSKTDFTINENDTSAPIANTTSPSDGESKSAGVFDVTGSATDDISGVSRVRVRIQRLGSSPSLYWNGNTWIASVSYVEANLSGNGENWTVPSVDLSVPANYRIRLIAYDVAGNIANANLNPRTDFTITLNDTNIPSAQTTSPFDGESVNAGVIDIVGSSTDDVSGVSRVRVRVQRLGTSPALFWNGSNWTSTSAFVDAVLNNNGSSWTLPNVNLSTPASYRIRLIVHDIAGNIARASDNGLTVFTSQ